MGYNLNVGFSKKFLERETRKEEMIYKAQIIKSVYGYVKKEVTNLKDLFDGYAYYKIVLIKYYYIINGLTIIINRRYDYSSQEQNDELEIKINEETVFDSMKNIYINGKWEKTFEELFKSSLKLTQEDNQKVYTKKQER